VDRVQHAIMRSSRGGPAIGIMFIDLDDFKTVNDSSWSCGRRPGPAGGRWAGAQATVRPADTDARFPAETSSAILLTGSTISSEAADVADACSGRSSGSSRSTAKQVYQVRASRHLSGRPGVRPADAEEPLRNADVARATWPICDNSRQLPGLRAETYERVVERLELQAEL